MCCQFVGCFEMHSQISRAFCFGKCANQLFSQSRRTFMTIHADAKDKFKDTYKTLIWLGGMNQESIIASNPFIQFIANNHLKPEDIPVQIHVLCGLEREHAAAGGMKAISWYEVLSDGVQNNEDSKGIIESSALINGVIEMSINEMENQDSSRVYIGGEDQGAAMALHCGLQCEKQLGGIIASGSYVLETSQFPEKIGQNNKDTKILVFHSSSTERIPIPVDSMWSTFENYLKDKNNIKYVISDKKKHLLTNDEGGKVLQFVQDTENMFEKLKCSAMKH